MAKISKVTNTDSAALIHSALLNLLKTDISELHKRDIENSVNKFLIFLIAHSIYNRPISEITIELVEEFLTEFYSKGQKGTSYLNNYKRVKAVFNKMYDDGIISNNIFNSIDKTLDIESNSNNKRILDKKSLHAVFEYLNENNINMYLFSVINYFLLLKASTIRRLKRENFNDKITLLTIEDYNGKIELSIPAPLRSILLELEIDKLDQTQNIFTHSDAEFSRNTFNHTWSKFKKRMQEKGIINSLDYEAETFADAKCIEVYSKNGDIVEIQNLLNFSDAYKTKQYLKSLFGDEFENIIKK